jgi:hypothetical protein
MLRLTRGRKITTEARRDREAKGGEIMIRIKNRNEKGDGD